MPRAPTSAKLSGMNRVLIPLVHAPDRDVSQMNVDFPERVGLKGVAKFKFDIMSAVPS
jgi:hypothetical protein